MLADRINAGKFTNRGTAGKWGEEARERGETQPEPASLASSTRATRTGPQRASLRRSFLEKELHRRYSKRELHNNKRSVPYPKSQSCVVFKKRKTTKHKTLM